MFTVYVVFEDEIHTFVKDNIAEARRLFNEMKNVFASRFEVAVKLFGPGRVRYRSASCRFAGHGGHIELF